MVLYCFDDANAQPSLLDLISFPCQPRAFQTVVVAYSLAYVHGISVDQCRQPREQRQSLHLCTTLAMHSRREDTYDAFYDGLTPTDLETLLERSDRLRSSAGHIQPVQVDGSQWRQL